jgi:hypothetical protein
VAVAGQPVYGPITSVICEHPDLSFRVVSQAVSLATVSKSWHFLSRRLPVCAWMGSRPRRRAGARMQAVLTGPIEQPRAR